MFRQGGRLARCLARCTHADLRACLRGGAVAGLSAEEASAWGEKEMVTEGAAGNRAEVLEEGTSAREEGRACNAVT